MNEALDRLIPLLEKLAEKIGAGSAFSWAVLLRQMQIHAVRDFIWGTALAALAVAVGWVVLPKTRLIQEYEDRAYMTVITYLIVLVFGGAALALLCDGLGRLLNPEFYAISWLLERVR